MTKRMLRVVCLAATVAAAALVPAAPAGAGPQAGALPISGSEASGLVSGSLVGTITETTDTFASFLATRQLTPSGIITWRAPVVFEGCVNGIHCGTLYLDGHYFYLFEPGTTYYDFELGGYQPGTIGDPASWISGRSVYRIVGGPGLEGASGMLAFTETEFLSAHTYGGVVHL